MSRHSRTRQSAPHAEQTTLLPSRPFSQDAPKVSSSNPAHGAGHDFRKVSIFPTAAIQRQSEGATGETADVPVAGGGGTMIPGAVRTAMEGAFDQDFGDVRIHTGPEAKQVGALAYTRGSNLHFQPGRYDPFSDTGRHLLGHELTHVVQQRAGRVAAPAQHKSEGVAPINADTALEAEADHQGAKAARGERASVSGAGSGIQRQADGSGAPIQREEDEAETKDKAETKDEAYARELAESAEAKKFYQVSAAPRPNEFLPNRRVPRPVNNSPERSSVRPTTNNGQRIADTGKVATFRNRMAGEMAAQKTMLATNDEAKQFPVHPLAQPSPGGWDVFQQQQRQERDKELAALSEGKTVSPPNQSGEFERDAKPNNRPNRPAPVSRPISPSKYVTAGTTAGTTPYNGGEGDEVKTRSGAPNASRLGSLENDLNNPSQSPALVDNHGSLKYPRQGLAARQQSIMETAEKADPLMRDLKKTDALSTHVAAHNRHENGGWLWPGHSVRGSTIVDQNSDPLYAVGANFFSEQRPIRSGGAERLLPQMTHWDNVAANDPDRIHESRPNVWSEADVKPATVDTSNKPWRPAQNGYARQQWPRVRLQERSEERLLHTHSTSRVDTPDGKGRQTTTASAPVDHRFYVTNDHYKSAVPVAPVAKDYKNSLPVNHPYKTDALDGPLGAGTAGPTRNSLNAHDNAEAERLKRAAGDDKLLRFQTSESFREQAGDEAKQGARRHANQERRRVHGAEFSQDQLAAQAGKDAERASAKRDREERDRVKWEGRYEDALPDKALADAQAASTRREAQEEARTQDDLKALAPSEGVQAMYGMSARTARTVAEKQMEMQHEAARAWTGGDHIVDGPSTARKPLSADAESMYG